jgi:hypothetical protein
MKIMSSILLLCAALGIGACAGGDKRTEVADVQGPRVLIGYEAGPSYQSLHWSGIMPITVRPQMAAWLETADGVFVATIYVTDKGMRDAWIGGTPRPEALPVWGAASGMGKKSPANDGVSGATPSSGAERVQGIPADLAPGAYTVKLEVNRSYDYNQAYPESDPKTGINGQPSVVYAGSIALGTPGARAALQPIGTGALDGSDGSIKPGLSGLTTALELILHPYAEYLN